MPSKGTNRKVAESERRRNAPDVVKSATTYCLGENGKFVGTLTLWGSGTSLGRALHVTLGKGGIASITANDTGNYLVTSSMKLSGKGAKSRITTHHWTWKKC